MVDTRRILIADDDQSIRQLLSTIVQREGLRVDCASDGIEAIAKLREREYAVILLDLMMPRTDGFEVIDYLKNNAPRQKPVILVITAYADQRFKKVDPDIVAGVIRKPFEVTELGALVRLCSAGYHEELTQPRSSSGGRATTDVAAGGLDVRSDPYTSN